MPTNYTDRIRRARLSLEGLSIGDAFGQQFFDPSMALRAKLTREPPPGRWRHTDDAEMAAAIYEVLVQHGTIHQDELARAFARRFQAQPTRGYGHSTIRVLQTILNGGSWRDAATSAFGGEGSKGNGAAMRVAPLGAYFADDLTAVEREAAASAEVTHAHPEARDGAIAVAIAAAWAWQWSTQGRRGDRIDLLRTAAAHTPPGTIRDGIDRAIGIDLDQ